MRADHPSTPDCRTVEKRLVIQIDALVIPDVLPFLRAVLGYQPVPTPRHGAERPARSVADFCFGQMDAPRPQRNRMHIDVSVPHDQAEARVETAIAAGGHLVTGKHAPGWWVLADAEGNAACVATWLSGG